MRNWVRAVIWEAIVNLIRSTMPAGPTIPNQPKIHLVRKLMVTIQLHSAALCQVYDSIFGDVPMARVKFNVNTEYAYIQNFKVLQSEYLNGKHILELVDLLPRTSHLSDRC